MSEAQLVSFGNYLFNRYRVFTKNEFGEPLYEKQVTDADISNWKSENDELQHMLPSAHQLGDKVLLCLAAYSPVSNCEVIKVHFSESKVLYDLSVPVSNGEITGYTRIYNIDSCFVACQE